MGVEQRSPRRAALARIAALRCRRVRTGGVLSLCRNLVYQLHEHLAAVPHTWLECGATPYTEGTPFHPIIALVSQGLALAPEDTAADKLGKLENGLGAFSSTETVALLADFLGLPPPTRLQGINQALSPDHHFLVGNDVTLADICFVAELSLFFNERMRGGELQKRGLANRFLTAF
jgi:glutathione S-transferase-like protein